MDGRLASHIGLWILGIGIIIWLVWSATHSNTENNRYAPGSASYGITNTYYPLSSLFPCGAFFKIDHETAQKQKIEKTDIIKK